MCGWRCEHGFDLRLKWPRLGRCRGSGSVRPCCGVALRQQCPGPGFSLPCFEHNSGEGTSCIVGGRASSAQTLTSTFKLGLDIGGSDARNACPRICGSTYGPGCDYPLRLYRARFGHSRPADGMMRSRMHFSHVLWLAARSPSLDRVVACRACPGHEGHLDADVNGEYPGFYFIFIFYRGRFGRRHRPRERCPSLCRIHCELCIHVGQLPT